MTKRSLPMSRRKFLYAMWCASIATGTIAAGYYAWSPFSDNSSSSGGAVGVRGPVHK